MPPALRLVRDKGRFAVQWYDEQGRHRSLLGTYDRVEADHRLAQFIAEREAEMRRVDPLSPKPGRTQRAADGILPHNAVQWPRGRSSPGWEGGISSHCGVMFSTS
jgi:hypothetical protein